MGANLPEDTQTWKPVRPNNWQLSSMLRGFTGSWSLWLTAAMGGVWLMFAPAAFDVGIQYAPAGDDHLIGALVVVVAVISPAEVARPARFLDLAFASTRSPWIGVWRDRR